MWEKITALIILWSGAPLFVNAQDISNIKFGNISERDFVNKVYPIDTNANAVVIAEIGSISIKGDDMGRYSSVFNHYKRIHVLNRNGFGAADITISLYSNGDDDEKLDKIKAVTYNLEDGKIIATNLDEKGGLFEDKVDKKWKIRKFTFPNVKAGSIIEYEYSTISYFIEYPDPWKFQGTYPILWNEFSFTAPSVFGYAFLSQGSIPYEINTRKEGKNNTYTIAETRGGNSRLLDMVVAPGNIAHRWGIRNVPALKEENFISTLENYLQKISFVLVERSNIYNNQMHLESWQQVAKWLRKSEYFGNQLIKDNGWLNGILESVVASVSGKMDKARKIYEYVRDNYKCTLHQGLFIDKSLKDIVREKNGNVAEINLLLTAMLKHMGIDADPVILSTKSNGFPSSLYPMISRYNYVICRTKIDGKYFYLDASEPILGFNHLSSQCYNGNARVINENADSLTLSPDSLREVKNTTVFLTNDEKGNMIGSMLQRPGYYESLSLRNRIKEKGEDELQNDIKKAFGSEITISNFVIDSLEKYENELGIKYDFDMVGEKEDIIYLNPMFGEGYKENPFKSAERIYPVEMPFTIDETYNMQMDIPEGYTVEELPKLMTVKFNEKNEGMFEYNISQSGDNITFHSRLKLNRANFQPDEYGMLRKFFSLVVKKQSEQIVFKKKK